MKGLMSLRIEIKNVEVLKSIIGKLLVMDNAF